MFIDYTEMEKEKKKKKKESNAHTHTHTECARRKSQASMILNKLLFMI